MFTTWNSAFPATCSSLVIALKSESASDHAVCLFQDEHYEEYEGEEAGIISSSFGRRSVELYDLPENERMFLPSNMDAAQLSFKFKEVIKRTKPAINKAKCSTYNSYDITYNVVVKL